MAAQNAVYDVEDLAWMFFVDGCAILHYIECVAEEDHKKLKALKIKNDHIAIAQQDLFLLENQLPFKVLELLIVGSNTHENKLKESIIKFVDGIIKSIRSGLPPNKPQQDKIPQLKATHLLELLRERLVGNNRQKVNETKNADWHSFRNIHELKAAGIQLERRETDHLTDISFASGIFPGTLELSPLVVDDSTAPKFLNMIAYEMCPDFNNEFEVTSYISFLDSLIDHPEDVKELRNKGILHNFLGSDEEVAKLFNEIGTDLVPDTDKYSEVKKLIQDHYNKKCNTWIAEFYHNHFSSP